MVEKGLFSYRDSSDGEDWAGRRWVRKGGLGASSYLLYQGKNGRLVSKP